MSDAKTRIGCLAVLGIFAAWIAGSVWFNGGSAEGGSAIAVGGLLALMLLYVFSGVGWLLRKWFPEKKRNPPRGFPIEPGQGPNPKSQNKDLNAE